MQLYSNDNQYSHQVRYTLAEKSVSAVVHPIDASDPDPGAHKAFAEASPRMCLPTLMDRDTVLTHTPVILEYLEDRYPYPILLPVLPADRADVRERMYRLYEEMCVPADIIMRSRASARTDKARKTLDANLSSLSRSFTNYDWCLSPEFTLLDCCIAPLLWRLDILGIKIKKNTQGGSRLLRYMARIFEREAFMGSMTQAEREMR